jgi:dipeptidyl-peptidase-4
MMKTKLSILGVVIILLGFSTKLVSQDSTKILTLDRIFSSAEFRQDRLQAVQWYGEEDAYTYLKRSENGTEIMLTSVKNGDESVLISATDLIPEGAEKPLSIASYSWSDDLSKLLIFTNTKRVWRANTKGDYWVFDTKTKALNQMGKTLPESSLMFAKFSPNQEFVAYVSEFNVYTENLESGEIVALTTDGNGDIINGTFDWVYEEEFSCRDGFRWSPDGKTIAFWQLDASDIRDFYMINNTDSVYSQIIPVQYPKVGEDPSSCKLGVVSTDSKEITWLKIPGDKKQNYIPRMQWIGDRVLAQQINRKQNELKLWICDRTNGDAKMFYTEKDKAWVDITNADFSETRRGMIDMPVIDDGAAVIRMTEKDGWRHLYKIEIESGNEKLLSMGDYDVGSLYTIDEKKGLIYISASPGNSTQRYLYSISLSSTESTKRVTPENEEGVHSYDFSPNAKYAFHTFSNANTPPVTDLVSLPKYKQVRVLVSNEAYKEKMQALDLPQWEFFSVTTADGVEMDGKILKPTNFDPTKKYPVLFYVYGEPWTQTAVDTWRFGWDYLLSQKGYVLITMDNRGTPCLKGSEWRKSIYRKIGVINSQDQAMATREIVKWDFVDPDRIAVWGWSGGGAMTLNLMFRYPEIYQTGMAIAAVTNQLYYDNIYQERYMGLPSENLEDFIEGSPIKYAKNLEGNLLLIHGTADDNVHFQNAEALVNELIKYNKQFQYMAYPNRSHGIYEGENTRLHLFTLLTNYLLDHVQPGGE